MTADLTLLVALALIVVLVGFLVVVTYNHVIGLQRRCEKAWANVDVALKQRHDQLPNLVAAVRSQLGFEQQVLSEVTRLRAEYSPDASIHEQATLSEATSTAVRTLFGVVEGYPELRSHENVMALQREIERLETLIARRRELFNEQVYAYHTAIDTLPGLLLRPLFGWRHIAFFRTDERERERPAVAATDTAAEDDRAVSGASEP